MLITLLSSANITMVCSSEMSNLLHNILKYSPTDKLGASDDLKAKPRPLTFESKESPI